MIENQTNKIVIVGAGETGSPILSTLMDKKHLVDVVGVIDMNPEAQGLKIASEAGIHTHHCVKKAIKHHGPAIYFNLTGDPEIDDIIADEVSPGAVIGGTEASLIMAIIHELKAQKNKLHYDAFHDVLTSAYNRRYIQEGLKNGLLEASRYKHPYSIVLVDLDHFKSVNDTYGHIAGDNVLIETVKSLMKNVRAADIIGRWGGEEFILLMPETSISGAIKAAQKCLLDFTALQIDMGKEKKSFSFSCGVAEFDINKPIDEKAISDLIHAADENLYKAKEQGRSRVVG